MLFHSQIMRELSVDPTVALLLSYLVHDLLTMKRAHSTEGGYDPTSPPQNHKSSAETFSTLILSTSDTLCGKKVPLCVSSHIPTSWGAMCLWKTCYCRLIEIVDAGREHVPRMDLNAVWSFRSFLPHGRLLDYSAKRSRWPGFVRCNACKQKV